MDTVVVLVLADPGEALTLATLSRVEGTSCRSVSRAGLNSTPVEDSVECSPRPGRDATATWVIGRHASLLEFLAGTSDAGATGSAVLRVSGDGVPLAEVPLRYGAADQVSVDVRGVLRLTVEVSTTATEAPTVVLGDARLRATAADIDAIMAGR